MYKIWNLIKSIDFMLLCNIVFAFLGAFFVISIGYTIMHEGGDWLGYLAVFLNLISCILHGITTYVKIFNN